MQIYEFCFVSRKQLCYCSLFRFGNIRFVFELSNKKAASLADAKVLKDILQYHIVSHFSCNIGNEKDTFTYVL